MTARPRGRHPNPSVPGHCHEGRLYLGRNPFFLFGLVTMTLAFYSLLFALSWADVSLVGPASASLTFVANAIAGKIFLHEQVDHRRWMAALMVAGGVALLAG